MQGSRIDTFVPRFPEELSDCRRFTAAEFRQAHPWLDRMFVAALPHEFRGSHELTFADRLPLPANKDAALWRLTFAKRDDASATREALIFSVNGTIVPVDWTDRCYDTLRVMVAPGEGVDRATWDRMLLALRYAVSRRVVEQHSLLPPYDALVCPDGVAEEKWAAAMDAARRFVVEMRAADPPPADQDIYFCVKRRDGIIVAFARDRTPVWTILSDPALVEKKTHVPSVWSPVADRTAGLSSADRDSERRRDAERAVRDYREWRPKSFDGDPAEIAERSRTIYAERRRKSPWKQVFPQESGATGTRVLAEAEQLFRAIQERCDDYSIPQDCLTACRTPNASEMKLRVRRRALPFYPAHRLYEILDRRGGRPRRTQVLFAPRDKPPAGVDRLIPLNNSAYTHHTLNRAYDVRLAGVMAVDYLDFFCDWISGREGGSFHIVESVDDVRWRGDDPRQRALLEQVAFPIRLWTSGDTMLMDAVLTYVGELFHANFEVAASGDVTMLEDRHILARANIVPELFRSSTHFFLRPPRDFTLPGKWQ